LGKGAKNRIKAAIKAQLSRLRVTIGGDIQKMFKISRQAAHKEIRKLLQVEIIERQGSGKGIFYVFK